jgi:hypothetical protein
MKAKLWFLWFVAVIVCLCFFAVPGHPFESCQAADRVFVVFGN